VSRIRRTSSAGTAIAAVEAVLDGDCLRSYALVRPPGHHAQPARTDGYCMFSNTALAAETALRRGVERVAIIDWDVHHGNGTQECFYDRGDVLSCSLHMPHGSWGPAHPQTGSTLEAGIGDGPTIRPARPTRTIRRLRRMENGKR
jgi:acetoin utilization deacetylase AcuC-like enzyme